MLGILVTLAAFSLGNSVTGAANIQGTVSDVSGDTATITVEGDMVPVPGDEAQIFFKLAGADDEISVARGKVLKVNDDAVEVKIGDATGTVEKGQLARITSDDPQKRTAATKPSATAIPAAKTSPPPTSSPSEPAKIPSPAQNPKPSGRDPSFAFVDMNKIFQDYPKTKTSEAKINDTKNSAKKEYDERTATYKAALAEITTLTKKLDSPKLSGPAKTEIASDRDSKIAATKQMETEINSFRATRERELQEQALKLREEIVAEMTATIKQLGGQNIDLLFDRSGMSLNGVPMVMVSPPAAEMSARVTSALQGQSAAGFEPTRGLMIGMVDMNRVFKSYNKTKDAEAKINTARNSAKKDYDRRADSYQSLLAKINELNKQLDSATGENAKARLAKDRDNKVSQVKTMEREINEFRQTREKQLQTEVVKLREGIVAEITAALSTKIAAERSALIFDSSSTSLSGAPLILSTSRIPDLSDEVIATLNKTAGKSASAATSLASSAGLQVGYIDMDRAFKAMPESKQAEAEINELKEAARTEIANADATVRAKKEKELQEIAMKKRETIIQKLTGSISQLAPSRGLNLVFDSSGKSLSGVPILVSARDLPDLTDDVVSRLASSSP